MSERPTLLTSTQLRERGWTPALVKKFLTGHKDETRKAVNETIRI